MALATEYEIMKKCCNCATINTKDRKSCHFCGMLFMGEVENV